MPHLQHFLQAVYFFFAWLSGMLLAFFIPEQLDLLWYFLLLRSIYTIVSPAVCRLSVFSSFTTTSSSILQPNVCAPPK
nr:MAG TPA: Macoilin family [Caudoviricetes sp.]